MQLAVLMSTLTVFVAAAVVGPAVVDATMQDKEQDPEPRVMTPGDATTPPSDAIVLFDGQDLSQWTKPNGWLFAKR